MNLGACRHNTDHKKGINDGARGIVLLGFYGKTRKAIIQPCPGISANGRETTIYKALMGSFPVIRNGTAGQKCHLSLLPDNGLILCFGANLAVPPRPVKSV